MYVQIPQTTTLHMKKMRQSSKSSQIKLIFIAAKGYKDHEQCCHYPHITITV